jgi:hypothetical protein
VFLLYLFIEFNLRFLSRNDGMEDRYSILISFDAQDSTDNFYKHFNGRRFSSLEVCQQIMGHGNHFNHNNAIIIIIIFLFFLFFYFFNSNIGRGLPCAFHHGCAVHWLNRTCTWICRKFN